MENTQRNANPTPFPPSNLNILMHGKQLNTIDTVDCLQLVNLGRSVELEGKSRLHNSNSLSFLTHPIMHPSLNLDCKGSLYHYINGSRLFENEQLAVNNRTNFCLPLGSVSGISFMISTFY